MRIVYPQHLFIFLLHFMHRIFMVRLSRITFHFTWIHFSLSTGLARSELYKMSCTLVRAQTKRRLGVLNVNMYVLMCDRFHFIDRSHVINSKFILLYWHSLITYMWLMHGKNISSLYIEA